MKAVCFANGFRERIVLESGGLDGLDSLFDFFIDSSSFMKPWEKMREFEDTLSHEKLVALSNEKELETLIVEHGISYILFIGLEDSQKIAEVLRLLTEHGVGYGIVNIRRDFYNYFFPDRSGTFLESIKTRMKLLKRQVISSIRSVGVPAPQHLFTNEPGALVFPKIDNRTVIKRINYRDYYLSVNHTEKPIDENYAVFLDQAYPYFYCMDHSIDRIITYYTEEKTKLYYRLINSYLKKLSDELNMKIVVCQHPNSPTSFRDYFLNEFTVTKFETGKYARFADLLVTHDSTSLTYGYMFDIKAVMLVFESAMHQEHVHHIKQKAKKQGLTLHRWPEERISFDSVEPPSDKRIKKFIVPNGKSVSLIDDIEEVLRSS